MELRRLEYFLVLARVLHFGRAAEQLHISQPGLSQQIKVLEHELGTPLIRRGKAITLTTAGEVLREQGERVLAEARLCVERVRAAAEQPGGVLRVAYTRSGADLTMHELVERFRLRYPAVRLSLSAAWTSRNLELLEAGEVDVAFVRSTVRHRAVESLVVATEELVVALPDDHPLAARERVLTDDVVELPLVHWPRTQGPGYHDEIRRLIWGDRPQRVVLEQPDAEHILREVAGRVGIAVLDEHRARKLCPPGVCATVRRAGPDHHAGAGMAAERRAGAGGPVRRPVPGAPGPPRQVSARGGDLQSGNGLPPRVPSPWRHRSGAGQRSLYAGAVPSKKPITNAYHWRENLYWTPRVGPC
ncbi:LysR substrate-binding domain-containing protein [Streptomyces sp. NPDC004752]